MCYPILVTVLKMRPHYSQSSRENATDVTAARLVYKTMKQRARSCIKKIKKFL